MTTTTVKTVQIETIKTITFFSQFIQPVLGMVAELVENEGSSDERYLESFFTAQGNNLNGDKIFTKVPSASCGDVVQIDERYYYCASVGFKPLTDAQFEQWCDAKSEDRNWIWGMNGRKL